MGLREVGEGSGGGEGKKTRRLTGLRRSFPRLLMRHKAPFLGVAGARNHLYKIRMRLIPSSSISRL